MSEPDLRPFAYVLAVNDLAGSAAYFVEVLGFSMEWTDGDNWKALRRGDVRLMLGRCPDALPPAKLGDHLAMACWSTPYYAGTSARR